MRVVQMNFPDKYKRRFDLLRWQSTTFPDWIAASKLQHQKLEEHCNAMGEWIDQQRMYPQRCRSNESMKKAEQQEARMEDAYAQFFHRLRREEGLTPNMAERVRKWDTKIECDPAWLPRLGIQEKRFQRVVVELAAFIKKYG